LGVLLAVSATPVVAPMTHLVSESGPKTLHPSFKQIYKQFDILKMIHMHVLCLLKNGLKKACKMGNFVSVKHFHVWGTQRVGSGQFFSTKLSGFHIDT
jgi:hypothetical protein